MLLIHDFNDLEMRAMRHEMTGSALGLGATNLNKSMTQQEINELMAFTNKAFYYKTKQNLEKPMRNLTITKPTLVGGINILEASDDTLAGLIREAQDQIKANADLAACSKKYASKNAELQKVIDACVEELDKTGK